MRQALVLAALLVGGQSHVLVPPRDSNCDSFCCSMTSHDSCCGANFTDGHPCPPGNESGYCTWTGNNLCERNYYGRGGPCTEIQLSFINVVLNASALAKVNQTAAQMAKEVVLLLGSPLNSVVAHSVEYNPGHLLYVVLRCPNGGCGSPKYIGRSLCFAGREMEEWPPPWDPVKVGYQGKGGYAVAKCLSTGANGPTEDQPKGDLAGLNPGYVEALKCVEPPPPCQYNCPANNGCNSSGVNCAAPTQCCGQNTVSPSCITDPSSTQCCSLYDGSTQCKKTEECCFSGGYDAFCCKEGTTCCGCSGSGANVCCNLTSEQCNCSPPSSAWCTPLNSPL